MQYLTILKRWRRFIILNTGILTLSGLILVFLVHPKYDAQTVVYPVTERSSIGQLTGQIPLSMIMGFSPVQRSSELFVEILNSRRLRVDLINRLDLVKELEAHDLEDALEKLDKIVKVGSDLSTGVVRISVRTKDPKLSADIANTMVAILDSINRNSIMYQGKRVRMMLEKRLRELEQQMKAAEESLKTFQMRNKTLSVEDEWKAVMDQYAELKAQEIEGQIKLNVLEEVASPQHPEVLKVKRNLEAIRKELDRFESTGQNGFGPGFSVPLNKMPEVSVELMRRMRDVEVYNQVYGFVVQQLEQARVMEKKDTPTLEVIDRAVPPQKKAWPRRGFTVISAVIVGLILGFIFSLLLEYRYQVERNPKHKDLKDLLDALGHDFHLK